MSNNKKKDDYDPNEYKDDDIDIYTNKKLPKNKDNRIDNEKNEFKVTVIKDDDTLAKIFNINMNFIPFLLSYPPIFLQIIPHIIIPITGPAKTSNIK